MSHSPAPWWSVDRDVKPAVVAVNKRARAKVIIAVTAIILSMGIAAFIVPADKPYAMPNGATQNPPSMSAIAASCNGIIDWSSPMSREDTGYTPNNVVHIYRTFPPIHGTYDKESLAPGIYDVPADASTIIPKAMNSLWHGKTIVWYRDDSLTKVEKNSLINTIKGTLPDGSYIIAAWPFDRLPQWGTNRAFVITHWDTSQSCDELYPDVLKEFAAWTKDRPAPGASLPLSQPGKKAPVSSYKVQ